MAGVVLACEKHAGLSPRSLVQKTMGGRQIKELVNASRRSPAFIGRNVGEAVGLQPRGPVQTCDSCGAPI